jgi:hypothetical protein
MQRRSLTGLSGWAILFALCCVMPSEAALIGFYPFEGNANDASGSGNHATVTNAAITASGYESQAYSFDGSNDFIEVPIDINPAQIPKLTMGAWANTDITNSIRAIISHDDGNFDRQINIDARGAGSGYRYSVFTGTTSPGVSSEGPDPAPTNQWVFVAARYDSVANTVTLDVDGARATFTATPGSGFNTTYIGINPPGTEDWDGRIDNVFFFDSILSDAAIDRIRQGGADAILTIPEPTSFALISLVAALLAVGRRRCNDRRR